MQAFEEIRQQLASQLARLEKRHEKIEKDLRKPGNRDWTERATETENDEVLEGLGAQEIGEIALIRDALERIERGTYGTCKECGKAIPVDRLRALPHATACVGCAQ
jgi:RNA polymerase-binding transcription factor DksA